MSLNSWLAFAAVFLALSYAPGPNMLLAASHGMLYGPRRTLPTAFGLVSGLWLWIAISAAGIGSLLAASESLFSLVRWVGAAYMLWLGWKALRAPEMELDGNDDAIGQASGWQRFRQGLAVCLSNPKAIVVFTALLPQFMDPARPLLPQVAMQTATISVLETSMILSSASAAGRLVPWLKRSGRIAWINRISGGVLILAALLMASLH